MLIYIYIYIYIYELKFLNDENILSWKIRKYKYISILLIISINLKIITNFPKN